MLKTDRESAKTYARSDWWTAKIRFGWVRKDLRKLRLNRAIGSLLDGLKWTWRALLWKYVRHY